jgi:hypothetical protein
MRCGGTPDKPEFFAEQKMRPNSSEYRNVAGHAKMATQFTHRALLW